MKTPNAERLHIGIFGKRNSGKSSLINALTGQDTAIVSATPGTTADPVAKPMEVRGVGAVNFIDTAGFDDDGELGRLRVARTEGAAERCDMAIVVFDSTKEDYDPEFAWVAKLRRKNIPVLLVLNKADIGPKLEKSKQQIELETGIAPLTVSALTGQGKDEILAALAPLVPTGFGERTITGDLCGEGDVVMLVMPQDSGAPKGRLILPQVQVTRELLDKKCVVVSVTAEKMPVALAALKDSPKLIITDSQAFAAVYAYKPHDSVLTSFSILFAAYKGDIERYFKGAQAIDSLNGRSKVLIAEACTHAPVSEDIGRKKIPTILRRKAGESIQIDVVSGSDFPEDLTGYDLVIHCGGCMFSRQHILNRLQRAVEQKVPITNYGLFLAKMNGILEKVYIQ